MSSLKPPLCLSLPTATKTSHLEVGEKGVDWGMEWDEVGVRVVCGGGVLDNKMLCRKQRYGAKHYSL